MEKETIEKITDKLERGFYREATELILMEMRSLSEEAGDSDITRDLEEIESILFDIPNIDWEKAEKEQAWVVRS